MRLSTFSNANDLHVCVCMYVFACVCVRVCSHAKRTMSFLEENLKSIIYLGALAWSPRPSFSVSCFLLGCIKAAQGGLLGETIYFRLGTHLPLPMTHHQTTSLARPLKYRYNHRWVLIPPPTSVLGYLPGHPALPVPTEQSKIMWSTSCTCSGLWSARGILIRLSLGRSPWAHRNFALHRPLLNFSLAEFPALPKTNTPPAPENRERSCTVAVIRVSEEEEEAEAPFSSARQPQLTPTTRPD